MAKQRKKRPKMKVCQTCNKRKVLDDYPGSAKSADGKMKNCRPCHGERCSSARKKSQATKTSTPAKPSGLSKKDAAKVAAANGALQIANGVRNKRSPFKTIVKQLYAQFAKEGFEVEHVEFVGNTARVRYSRTEEIKL